MLQSGVVRALGTMSGTSLDGVDAAVVETDGITISGFGPSSYRAYTSAEQDGVRAAFGRWQEEDVAQAARIVEDAHIAVMQPFDDIAIAGFHGQTLAHDPGGRGTHQCGDGARLMNALGYPVVWDFRSEDMRRGGQGAPLAPFYHFALAQYMNLRDPVAFVNLGGVGNITWIDPSFDAPEDDSALLAFDTGPANAPINDLMQMRRGQAFDIDGALASAGQPEEAVLEQFAAHAYFDATPPKSLDRDDFEFLMGAVQGLSDADAVATLTQAAVIGVERAVAVCPAVPAQIIVVGGGRKNATLMQMLTQRLPCDVVTAEQVGLDGDMIEAQAFGYLAVRVARGLPTSCVGTTGTGGAVSGGTLSALV